MQLISLYIKKYNHLVDFTIAFNQSLSVIIGVNGSGKSSVLEVLALVLSDAYLGKKAAFGFKLTYKLAKTTIELSAEDTGFDIQMNSKKIDNSLLPSNVVVYYSGLSDKMEKLCKIHEENQEKAFKTGRATKRPFFYYRPQNFKMFLLSLSAFEFGDTKDFILKKINLTGLDKFSIEILEPVWNEKRASSSDFWGLDGVNRDFCDRLDEFADDKSVNKSDSLIKYSFNSIEKLYDIKNYIGEKEIFESLDMLFFQGMLGEISLSLKKNDQIIDAEALSEDEKQIIAIRGINDLNKFLNLNEGNLKKAREAIYTTVARKTISDLKLLLDRKAKNDYLNKQINGWLQAKDGKYREYCMVAVWYLQSKIR